MVNPRRNENSSREIVPAVNEYPRPSLLMPPAGDYYYYYGRTQPKAAIVRTYLQLFHRQRWVMAITFTLVILLGMAWVLTRPTLYQSGTEILVTPIENMSTDSDNLAQDIGVMTRVRSVATQMKLLNNQDLLDEAFAELPAPLRRKGFGANGLSLSKYPVTITNPRDTDVIRIEVTATDPAAAARFANQIVHTSLKRSQETTRDIAELATQHVNTELATCEENLQQALAQMAEEKRKRNVVDVGAQATAESQALASLQSQAAQAQSEMVRAQVSRQMLERQLRSMSEKIVDTVTSTDNPVIQTIDAEIERLQQQRASLLQEYVPTAPEIQQIDEQITEAKKRKEEALSHRAESVTVKRNPLLDTLQQEYINAIVAEREAAGRANITRAQANDVRQRMTALPQAEETFALLNSRIAELQETHAYLINQRQALTLSMHGGLPNAMPITKARVNRFPVSPNIPVGIMLTLILAGALAIGVAMLREQVDDRVHTAETLESLTGHRVLASLPRVRNGMQGIISQETCPQAMLESFRILRGNILPSSPSRLPRSVMVTSVQSGEGKSTTVANLAAAMAINGNRVLVIDGDLRHPSMHTLYGLENTVGLSDLLQGMCTFAEARQSVPEIDVDLIAAGSRAAFPTELLASSAMHEVLRQASHHYDTVLVDSPPMLHLSDGSALATQVDGVLLVVSADSSNQADVLTVLRTLEHTETPILGVIYNRATEIPELTWKTE